MFESYVIHAIGLSVTAHARIRLRAVERRMALEHELQMLRADRQHEPRALLRWLGCRLVRLGERLCTGGASGPVAAKPPRVS